MNAKVKIARLSVLSNTLLIVMKLTVGLVSGSVSILSEAIHSGMDLVAAVIAFFSVRVADTPPDARHPWGHGKIENVSGVIEAVLIFVAAGWIIYEAVRKLLGEPIGLENVWLGVLVMTASAAVNWVVSRKLYRVARQTGSVALEADALHLKTDVYTSAGVALGLGLIVVTGVEWLDPAVAIVVALFIVSESWSLLRRAFTPLLDVAWDAREIAELERTLRELGVDYHDLRTRVAGNYRFVDVHVVVPGEQTVDAGHRFCDDIEARLQAAYQHLSVTIHLEPRDRPSAAALPAAAAPPAAPGGR